MGWVEEKVERKVEHLASTVSLEGEKTRLAMAAGLAETQRGQRIDGALSRPLLPNALNYSSGRRLVGWSVRAAGGAALINFRDGHDAAGDIIGTVSLTDGQSQTIHVMPAGVSFVEALYVEVIGAGAVIGAVWIGAVD